jgi:hypothetical protein
MTKPVIITGFQVGSQGLIFESKEELDKHIEEEHSEIE